MQYIIPIIRGNEYTKALLSINPTSFEDVFTYNGRAIQAHKIEENGFNVFVYFDAMLYANELSDCIDRAEKDNNSRQKQIELENARRNRGKGRLSDDELKALKPKNLVEFRNNNPEMGTVSIRTNQTKLNSSQVYRIYKQRQAIEQFF